ncbi:MAG: recombination regulator RecX [Oscillospiraceae bacterium]|jgi:regulatory protein|nr:recombination regulator RecX [Oscillospiraceae bacterium]
MPLDTFDETNAMRELPEYKAAYNRALRLITFRDHTEKELYDKLEKDFEDELCQAVCDHMTELGFVNDEAYGTRYAKSLQNTKHLSQKNIMYKLIQKGIDKTLAEEIAENLELDPVEEIKALLQKKYYKQLGSEKDIKRTFAALQRIGHRYDDIKTAIEEYTEEELF